MYKAELNNSVSTTFSHAPADLMVIGNKFGVSSAEVRVGDLPTQHNALAPLSVIFEPSAPVCASMRQCTLHTNTHEKKSRTTITQHTQVCPTHLLYAM